MNDQWLFPLSALHETPSNWHIEKEMYDRARGIEFLFRLGSSLALYVTQSCPSLSVQTRAKGLHQPS
jgi:hypothetical protein